MRADWVPALLSNCKDEYSSRHNFLLHHFWNSPQENPEGYLTVLNRRPLPTDQSPWWGGSFGQANRRILPRLPYLPKITGDWLHSLPPNNGCVLCNALHKHEHRWEIHPCAYMVRKFDDCRTNHTESAGLPHLFAVPFQPVRHNVQSGILPDSVRSLPSQNQNVQSQCRVLLWYRVPADIPDIPNAEDVHKFRNLRSKLFPPVSDKTRTRKAYTL